MPANQTSIAGIDNHPIPLHHWDCEKPKAVILLLHGMAEHAARYQQFSRSLNQSGYSVIAPNHRGHGIDIPKEKQGHFADSDGWKKVLSDINAVHKHICHKYPELPIYIMGHSMGSFITQAWLITKPSRVNGVILSGSNYAPRMLLKLGRMAATFERFRQGTNGHSKLIDTLSFGSYNNAFKPVRTPFDWLSRDSAEVDKYIADPCCGFLCTNQFWLDLFDGLLSITSVDALSNIDSQLPFYIFGGSEDPVGQQGKGLQKLSSVLKKASVQNITVDIWPDGRHEMLNEINRSEVTTKLLQWLEQQVKNH